MPVHSVDDGDRALPGWLELDGGEQLFHWLHRPAAARDLAVVIAGPIGPEYMHCRRAVKRLAESLAAAGIACLRYDPLAYGNSSGAPFDDALVARWQATLCQLVARLRAQGPFARIGLVALRSAALLAERLLAEEDMLDSLVYWYPYRQGAAFLRDMEMIDELIDSDQRDRPYVNAGGYPLSEQTRSALAALRLGDAGHRVRRALLLRAGERSSRPHPVQRLLAERDVDCREIASDALPKMARQAELSELPENDIAAITAWLAADAAPLAGEVLRDWSGQRQFTGERLCESIVRHPGPPSLFGILCVPAAGLDRQRPLVVLPNSGAGHHAGPNRLHVDLARQLAAVGLASLRFDLATLGDSPAPGADDDNHPYPPGAVNDIDAMLAALEQGHGTRRYVVAGLCSGAYSAFHAQRRLEQRDIVETLLINPLTFYLEPGESIIEPEAAKSALRQQYYRGRARDWRTWLRLAGNPRKVISIAGFVGLQAARQLGRWVGPLAVRAGLAEPAPLARDIDALLARGHRLTFIVSTGDPGYSVIMDAAGRSIRGGIESGQIVVERPAATDHTFSTLDSRRELIDWIVRHLERRYPA